MGTLSAMELGLSVTIMALAGISVVTAAASFLAQSASATTDVMTNTTAGEGGGEEETVSTTTATTSINDNVTNALLGPPFMTVEFETASVNAMNETYIEIATANDVTLIPPNATTGTTTINATETTNTTIDILPNGHDIDKGQS